MWERVGVIVRKEFIQMLREPRMRVLLFLPPVLQLVVFGYAVTLDVDHARIAWMDMDQTPESRALLSRFEGSGRFDVVAMPRSEAEVQRILDRSEAHAVVRVLPGFARDLARKRSTQVQVLVDGAEPNTANFVLCRLGHHRILERRVVQSGEHRFGGEFQQGRHGVSSGFPARPSVVQPRPAQPQLFRAWRRG